MTCELIEVVVAENEGASETRDPEADVNDRRDTIRETPAEDVSTTALSVDSSDSTLLSNPQPSERDDAGLSARLGELEQRHDALQARVRLLEKRLHEPPLGRSALWLLVFPVVALLWWLTKNFGH